MSSAGIAFPQGRLRIVVCGSRWWNDYNFLAACLDQLNVVELAHGGAQRRDPRHPSLLIGADYLAGVWARRHDVPEQCFPADWNEYGLSAGPRRNKVMLETFRPDLVLAFKRDFDSTMRRGGTEHTVRLARSSGIPTLVFTEPLFDENGAIPFEDMDR